MSRAGGRLRSRRTVACSARDSISPRFCVIYFGSRLSALAIGNGLGLPSAVGRACKRVNPIRNHTLLPLHPIPSGSFRTIGYLPLLLAGKSYSNHRVAQAPQLGAVPGNSTPHGR